MARELKSSKIAWVGNIPITWDIQRGKNILTILERPVKDDDGIITCFRDGEVTLRSNRREEGFTMSDKEIGYQGIDVGDLVVHGMDGFAGAIGISDSRGKATPVLNVMDSSQNKRYLMYYLRCAAHSGLFLSLSTGIRVRSCDTNWNKLKNVLFVLPSIDEQEFIVSFLDMECARIDAVIEQTRVSIDEYKKLKQAVITQAVTKGIRSNRQMKDSGIEGIEQVPRDWDISRFKYVCRINTEFVDPQTGKYDELPHIGPGNIEKFTGRLTDYKLVKEEGLISGKYHFYSNEIVYGKINPQLGKVTYPRFEGLCSADAYAIHTFEEIMDTEYLLYYMLSQQFIDMTILESLRMGMPKINSQDLMKLPILVPGLEEQSDIVQYLNTKCREIDKLVDVKQRLLLDLEAYKQSLIYEYVTGKKEVPT